MLASMKMCPRGAPFSVLANVVKSSILPWNFWKIVFMSGAFDDSRPVLKAWLPLWLVGGPCLSPRRFLAALV